MTRLAILADIHGNLPALEAVLADVRRQGADQIIVAGDIIHWAPWSREVFARVQAEGWPVIQGNHELYLLDYNTPRAPAEWSDQTQWAMLPWLHAQFDRAAMDAIAAWPDSLSLRFPDAPPLRVVHGSPRSRTEGIYAATPADQVAAMLAGVEEPAIVAAHTHLPLDRRLGPWQIFNPGSVGVPLDGRQCSRYLLLDGDRAGWRATFRALPHDPQVVLAALAARRFVEHCGAVGRLVELEFERARTELLPFLLWRQGRCPARPIGFDTLASYLASGERGAFVPAPYLAAEAAAAAGGPD